MSIKDNYGTMANKDVALEINKEEILKAIKLISSTRPASVKPYSIGMIGGVKVISNPMLKDNEIIVSDDIFSYLNQLAEGINNEG